MKNNKYKKINDKIRIFEKIKLMVKWIIIT